MVEFTLDKLESQLMKDDTAEIMIVSGIKVYKASYLDKNKTATGRFIPLTDYKDISESRIESLLDNLLDKLVIDKDIDFGGRLSIGNNVYKVFINKGLKVESLTIRRIKRIKGGYKM